MSYLIEMWSFDPGLGEPWDSSLIVEFPIGERSSLMAASVPSLAQHGQLVFIASGAQPPAATSERCRETRSLEPPTGHHPDRDLSPAHSLWR